MSQIKRTIYVVGGSVGYAVWMQGRLVDRMEDAELVVWTGGEDCSSEMYGARAHPATWSNRARDDREMIAFKRARDMGKHLIGICRGHQYLSVMAGAKLVQDQQNPAFWHPMQTIDGRTIHVTSTHHQAAHPWNLPPDQFKVLGWTIGASAYHWGEEDGDEMVIGRAPEDREIEECWYPRIRALTLQHHVEMAFGQYGRDARVTEYVDHCRMLLDAHMANRLDAAPAAVGSIPHSGDLA